MATIYQLNGTSVYDNNGQTFNAKTGQVYVAPGANPNDAAVGSGSFGQPVKGEPAVLSSVSGAQNFQSDVQPKIDKANQTVADSQAAKAARDKIAADAALKQPEPLPADVQAELDAAKTPQQKLDEERLASLDQQKNDITSQYQNLTLSSDSAAAASIDALTRQWQQRHSLLVASNKANKDNWAQQFLRTGQAEYSPGMTSDFLTAKEREGAQKVQELDDQYNSNVAQINTALEQGDYERAATLTSKLNDIQTQAFDVMQKNVDEAKTINDAIQKQRTQASRDTAIAGLVSQGVTDPTKILDYLNFYDNGQPTGGDFTAEEVANTLNNMTVDNNAKNLSSDLATFQYIRDNIGLPEDIASLPPEQQYFAYLKRIKQATTAPSSSSSTAGGYSAQEQRKLRAAGIDPNDVKSADAFLYGDTSGNGNSSDFEKARQFIKDNPDATRADLNAALREKTKLADGDITALLDQAGVVDEQANTTGQEDKIAIALVKSQGFGGSAQAAIDYLNSGGGININNKTVQLSNRQKQAIISAINKQYPSGSRTVMESVLPWGK